MTIKYTRHEFAFLPYDDEDLDAYAPSHVFPSDFDPTKDTDKPWLTTTICYPTMGGRRDRIIYGLKQLSEQAEQESIESEWFVSTFGCDQSLSGFAAVRAHGETNWCLSHVQLTIPKPEIKIKDRTEEV